MSSKLETLPWLALSRICEYLDNDDDYDSNYSYPARERRKDLWAFSLTSRQCCAISERQRFCQVRVTLAVLDDLKRVLEQCAQMLGRDDRHRYVRRLSVTPPDQNHVDDDRSQRYDPPSLSSVPYFCQPPREPNEWRPLTNDAAGEITSTEGPWLPLVRFINQLPALTDLAWGFAVMPRSILSVIHSVRACRLHMHNFWLPSLVVPRNGPPQVVTINSADYALMTSPALYSVVAKARSYEPNGTLNYTEEALMAMAAGAAPNLQHISVVASPPGNSVHLRQAVALGKPPVINLKNILPSKAHAGNLRYLFFLGRAPRNINAWAACTNFSKLRHLVLPWTSGAIAASMGVAARGDLASLKDLWIYCDTKDWDSFPRLLESLNPHSLQRLHLSGYFNTTLFNAILDHHGRSLRHLFLLSYSDFKDEAAVMVLTPVEATLISQKCPNLEHLWLQVDRKMGNGHECALYRALGGLRKLRRLFLSLRYSVDPDYQDWDENPDPDEDISRKLLGQGFANAAVDAALVRSIFDVISLHNPNLQYLQITTERKEQGDPLGLDDQRFSNLLRWFARSWVCERTNSGGNAPVVTIRELNPKETVEAGKEWQRLAETQEDSGVGRIYGEAFGDIWPRDTPGWWDEWKSLPLCPDDTSVEGGGGDRPLERVQNNF